MRQRENLKSARVCQHGAIPINKAVDAAQALEHLGARTEQQMIRVRENHARSRCCKAVDCLRLDGRLRSDRHKNRRLDVAVESVEFSCARICAAGLFFDSEVQTTLKV